MDDCAFLHVPSIGQCSDFQVFSGGWARIKHPHWALGGNSVPTHFLHVGKTGGSAVKHALEPFRKTHGIVLHPHATTLADIPRGERFFFFLRHPIPRFVSGFYSRQRQGKPRYNSPWSDAERRAFSQFKTPDQLASALTSPWWPRRREARNAMTEIQHVKNSFYHWIVSDELFEERKPDLLLIGFQERLNDDFHVLKNLLGLPSELALPRDEVLAHKNPVYIERSLSGRSLKNLEHFYRRDIAFYERLFSAHQNVSHSMQDSGAGDDI